MLQYIINFLTNNQENIKEKVFEENGKIFIAKHKSIVSTDELMEQLGKQGIVKIYNDIYVFDYDNDQSGEFELLGNSNDQA